MIANWYQSKLAEKTDNIYNKINSIANEYFLKLKGGFDIAGALEFLKTQVKNLKVQFLNLPPYIAGCATFSPPREDFSDAGYDLIINQNQTAECFDAALHEGYHILQFDNDRDQPFVKLQKCLVCNDSDDIEAVKHHKETLDNLLKIIFLPLFQNTYQSISHNLKTSYLNNEAISEESLFEKDNTLLSQQHQQWFKDLPDIAALNYVKSLAEIEINAHSFCLSKNNQPLIFDRFNVNTSKIRDLLAIRLYQEIINVAQSEIDSRQ